MVPTNEGRLDSLFQIMSTELNERMLDRSSDPALIRLSNRMRKRAAYTKNGLNEEFLQKFITLNESLKDVRIDLPADIVANARYYITYIFERFNSRLDESNIQETLDISYFDNLWKFGPGASHGVKGTHTADKIHQKMTCTVSAEPLVVHMRRCNHYFSAFDAGNKDNGIISYKGSKLTTVPKNEDSVRIIAIEPSGNMALQLAAGQYITDVLRSIGLDISTQQPKNKRLAELGSLDNSLATIDLKSASDMFTPELIRLLMPTKWFELLMKIRSPYTLIGDEWHELNMISTMGNGFTFPLMTLCLSSLIYALRCRHNGPNLFINWSRTAVFGDDIIISSSEYDEFCDLLSKAGLVVNHDKSFRDGPFRESCGGDYYLGRDITPFYVRSLSEDSEIYVAINQVLLWSSRHCLLPNTLVYLKSLLRKTFFVPEWSNPDQGILTAEVEKRYKFLMPDIVEKKLTTSFFTLPLAIGGYIVSRGPDCYYAPRQFKTRYVVRRGRLPNSFLSGRDPRKWDSATSSRISFFVDLLFHSHE